MDQPAVTGEAMPVVKEPGDQVYAGSVNGTGLLHVRVARPERAPPQLLVERVEQCYSIGVVAATLALAGLPLLYEAGSGHTEIIRASGRVAVGR